MHLRQYISSVVVALCVADHVAGQTEPLSRRVQNSVAHIERDTVATHALSENTDTAFDNDATTPELSNTAALSNAGVRNEENHENDRLSSSESLPTTGTDRMDTPSPVVHLLIRQEEEEAIPTPDPNALPIEPKITPAMGIAGAIMLGTGVALCLVGIKRSWLHIFLSTGYLASLAVTVLIIYVMNPEHSDAIQGAYVVAAVVTGLIFGAVSLVFQEVTEGLGCMLGSFCFAMWILVLAPGGVIHSTAGRGILIGVITVAGFGLSLTHYTRMYALLCCTSFAGATITILGVDCFSRAGLKEFWLYLWQLNDKQFPLGTSTYPITRGIRVEIAVIIVVFLLGLVSQFKLWKVIKARRDKHEEDRKRAEDERLEAEAAVGRDIEANNQRERAEWEAVYGEKGASRVHCDSGVGSSVETFGKDHVSVKEREVDPIELSDIPEVQSGRNSNGEKESTGEGQRTSGELAEGAVESGERSHRTSRDSMQRSEAGTAGPEEHDKEVHELETPYAPGAPEVVPLPFTVPTGEQEEGPKSVQQSRASKEQENEATPSSVAWPLQKISLAQLNQQFASDVFERRDDQASSVAATADDVAVMGDETPGRLSKRQSLFVQDLEDTDRLAPPQDERDRSRRTSVASEREMEVALDEDDEEALPRDPVTIDETATPVPAGLTKKGSTATKSERRLSDATRISKRDDSSQGHPGSVSEGLVEQLPPKLSKIALTYRTNEWAKHIADADQPENPEELERPSSPGVQVDTKFPKEVPRPVDVEALQQTAAPAEPAVPSHSTSKASKKSHRKSRQSEPVNNLNRSSSTQSATPVYAFNRSSSQLSLNRNDSTSSSPARPKLGSMRQSSMPLTNQTLVESPVEDAAETFQPHDFAQRTNVYPNALASSSASNLLDERNQMLQRRPTTVSFNGFRSTPSLGMMSGAIPEGQVLQSEEPQPTQQQQGFASPSQSSPQLSSDGENMTLSQRRSLMQLNQQPSNNVTATPTHKPRASIYSTLAYDSHQPARQSSTNSVQQSQRLNQWRQTLQADVQAKQPPRVVETNARQNMIDERRQSEARHARKKEEEGRRQSMMDEAMRRGHLDGAHRDAMRRMQAKANKDSA